MKKLLLCFLCIALGLHCAKAEEEVANGFLIEQKNGVTVGFLFANEPVMTYTETEIVLNGKDIDVRYPMAEVERMTFGVVSDTQTAVQTAKSQKISVAYDAETIRITGLSDGEKVTMLGVDGKLVGSAKADGNGVAILRCKVQTNSPYLVKTYKAAFKFIKK